MRSWWYQVGILVFFGVFPWGGCLDMGAAAISSGPDGPPLCSQDADCSGGAVCAPNSQMCVAQGTTKLTASVRLVPPTLGALALEEQYVSVELNSDTHANFQLHRPLRVVGRVFLEDNPLSAVASVEVAVAGASEIPGLEAQAQAVSGLPFLPGLGETQKPSPEGSFEFYVLKNRMYDIYVHLPALSSQDLPPYHVRRSFSPLPNAADPYTVTMDLQVPSLGSYVPLQGTLVWRSTPGAEVAAFSGAKIVAFSKETGNVSSSAVTAADGTFQLMVQPPEGMPSETYSLQLRPSAVNELVPELTLGDVSTAETPELGEFELLGSMVPQDVVVTVGGVPEDQAASLVGAVVRAESSWGENGSLVIERSLQGTTWTSMKLPPGLYNFSITPPSQSLWSSTWQSVTIQDIGAVQGAESQQVEFVMEPRHSLTGKLATPGGRLVADAQVRAIRYATPFGMDIPRKDSAASVFSTFSNSDGSYALSVDSGTYLLVVDPPLSSGLPRTLLWDVVVVEPSEADVPIHLPHTFAGDVQATNGQPSEDSGTAATELILGPAAGIRLEVYDPSWPANISPIPLAEGLTDESGHFVLLMPAQPGD